MRFIFRRFHATCGHEDRLIASLQVSASEQVRAGLVDWSMICREIHDCRRVLSLEAGAEGTLDARSAVKVEGDAAELEPQVLQFVGGYWRSARRPTRVWYLEIDRLFDPRSLARGVRSLAEHHEQLLGISVYRLLSDPATAMGFVALSRGATPRQLFGMPVSGLRAMPLVAACRRWHEVSIVSTRMRMPTEQARRLSIATGLPVFATDG